MKRSSVVALAVAVPLVLAGCTPEASTTAVPAASVPAPSASSSAQVLPPTVVSPGELDGTDASVVIGTALVIAAPDGTEAEWSGTTEDRTVAEFSAGGASEGATFRPGFEARAVGVTKATLTGPDGHVISFRISVIAP